MREVVIKIPEEMYKWVCDVNKFSNDYRTGDFIDLIKNGTLLPKGHGRLKDVDAFITKVKADRKHSVYSRSWTADDVLNALDYNYAPTIIEVDKE